MPNHPEPSANGPAVSKAEIRARALENRCRLLDREARSSAVCTRFWELPLFSDSQAVLAYMSVRDEVITTELVDRLLASNKRTVVPYCVGDELRLFLLSSLAELELGTFGILEPRQSLRSLPEKCIEPRELDLLAVPGVAFDRSGGRVGHGRGYFDGLLQQVRPDAFSIGLAFECQLFDQVPMDTHDVQLDAIVTEEAVYFRR